MELQADFRQSIDDLNEHELDLKKKDILACLASAAPEKKDKYGEQLWYIIQVMTSVKDISLVLKDEEE